MAVTNKQSVRQYLRVPELPDLIDLTVDAKHDRSLKDMIDRTLKVYGLDPNGRSLTLFIPLDPNVVNKLGEAETLAIANQASTHLLHQRHVPLEMVNQVKIQLAHVTNGEKEPYPVEGDEEGSGNYIIYESFPEKEGVRLDSVEDEFI